MTLYPWALAKQQKRAWVDGWTDFKFPPKFRIWNVLPNPSRIGNVHTFPPCFKKYKTRDAWLITSLNQIKSKLNEPKPNAMEIPHSNSEKDPSNQREGTNRGTMRFGGTSGVNWRGGGDVHSFRDNYADESYR
ncbi:hypothetical protein OUZ56_020725 [Daphnia magna]|uniref:Uncharacterized protein n=1 Tax=Daphnia magna TaxID=35525 RepID=A0ABQ9ZF97_9CRUS|nr:hypothetical protein OUZ56_020725 [Daphnia magna]